MRMLSIHSYYEIKDENAKSCGFMKYVIIVSQDKKLEYEKFSIIWRRFQIIILNGLARVADTYKQTNKQTYNTAHFRTWHYTIV